MNKTRKKITLRQTICMPKKYQDVIHFDQDSVYTNLRSQTAAYYTVLTHRRPYTSVYLSEFVMCTYSLYQLTCVILFVTWSNCEVKLTKCRARDCNKQCWHNSKAASNLGPFHGRHFSLTKPEVSFEAAMSRANLALLMALLTVINMFCLAIQTSSGRAGGL